MTEKNWKNRGKYGEGWTQAEELEIALRLLKEAREQERAAKGLSRTSPGKERKSSS
jgi:hypothetical protein